MESKVNITQKQLLKNRALISKEAQKVPPAMGAAMAQWAQCIPYGKTGLNMAAKGFICASLLFRVLHENTFQYWAGLALFM